MSYTILGEYEENIGGKAAGFYNLKTAGVDFPAGFVLKQQEIEDILKGEDAQLKDCLSKLGEYLAVRSSADVEDGSSWSFAGMFCTCLNVKNKAEKVTEAIRQVYHSKGNSYLDDYQKRPGKDIEMAVIIQNMIPDIKYNGVLFGDIVDERGNAPILLEFCKEGENKIVDGHDRGNQVLIYNNNLLWFLRNHIQGRGEGFELAFSA